MVIALAMAAHATVQGHAESTYSLDAFSSENFDWQGLRTYYYLASGERVILPGRYHY